MKVASPATVAVFLVLTIVPHAAGIRIVTIGDLHGDMDQAMLLLKSTNLISFQPDYYKDQLLNDARKAVISGKEIDIDRNDINANMVYNKRGHLMAGEDAASYHWSGGKDICVIVGDSFNVGPGDIDIARLFMRLTKEADAAGGHFEYLFGNHEVQNLGNSYMGVHPWSFERSGGRDGRTHLLSMETELGRFMRTRNAFFEYDGLIFVHGGLFPSTVKAIKDGLGSDYKRETFVKEVNRRVTAALTTPPHKPVGRDSKDPIARLILDWDYKVNGANGPLLVHPLKECGKVDKANDMLGKVQAQVVGHTPHKPPTFEYCNGSLFAVDFGMSQWKGGKNAASMALEFTRHQAGPGRRTVDSDGYHWHANLLFPPMVGTFEGPDDSQTGSYSAGAVAAVGLAAALTGVIFVRYALGWRSASEFDRQPRLVDSTKPSYGTNA